MKPKYIILWQEVPIGIEKQFRQFAPYRTSEPSQIEYFNYPSQAKIVLNKMIGSGLKDLRVGKIEFRIT